MAFPDLAPYFVNPFGHKALLFQGRDSPRILLLQRSASLNVGGLYFMAHQTESIAA
jgi:hypothetical protein